MGLAVRPDCQHVPGGDVASRSVVGIYRGPGAVTGTGGALAEPRPVKQTRFATIAEWYSIEDDEFTEFTFDNTWPDGTPKVRNISKRREGPPPRSRSSIAESIWAHRRAVEWVTGGIRDDLQHARSICHVGRVPVYEDYPDNELDIEFYMDQDILNKTFDMYSLKDLVVWDRTEVYYIDWDADNMQFVVHDPRDHGIAKLATRWTQCYHVGDVPAKPVAGDVACNALVGQAGWDKGLTWIVDSGASLHLANIHECKANGVTLRENDEAVITRGVGGTVESWETAVVHCKELGCKVEATTSESEFNLMSLVGICNDERIGFVYLPDLGLPPYFLLPGREKAIVLDIELNTPVYRQNDPNMRPENL